MEFKKLFSDSLWSIGGHVFSLFITLTSNIILARILSPEEFGKLGIIMFFVTIFHVFSDGGMGGALVRKLNKTNEDYSTVFTFNFLVSLILFILIYLGSGMIADFYNIPSLKNPIIFSGFILIISCFQTIQNIKIISELKFRTKSIIVFVSALLGASIGLILAYFYDLGLWALISIPVSTISFQTLFLIVSEGFFFKLKINKKSFKELYGFGMNTTIVSLLNIGFDNIYNLIIGKVISVGEVGLFYQAKKLQDVPNNVVNNLSQGVFYSNLSKFQKENGKVIQTYYLISKSFLWFMGLLVLIILLFGDKIIYFLLGDQWLGVVMYIKILIWGSLFYTQELINKTIFKVYNKTQILLRLEIFKKLIQVSTLILGVYLVRIDVLLYGYVFTNSFSYFINYYYTSRIIDIGKIEIYSLLKVCIVILVLFGLNNYINLYFGSVIFNYFSYLLIFLYILSSHVLGIMNFQYIKFMINKGGL